MNTASSVVLEPESATLPESKPETAEQPLTFARHFAQQWRSAPRGADYEFDRMARVVQDTAMRSLTDQERESYRATFERIMASCHWLRPALADLLTAYDDAKRRGAPFRPEDALEVIAAHDGWRDTVFVMYETNSLE